MKKGIFRRYAALLLALALILSMLPSTALAATTYTIKFVDENGDPVEVDSVSASIDGEALELTKTGTGTYTFTQDQQSYLFSIKLSASAAGYETISNADQLYILSTTLTVTLEKAAAQEETVTITVQDQSGNAVEPDSISVTTDGTAATLTKSSTGVYTFTRASGSSSSLSIEAAGYSDHSSTISAGTTEVTAVLSALPKETVTVTVQDENGTLVDPETISVTVDGATVTPTQVSTGVYTFTRASGSSADLTIQDSRYEDYSAVVSSDTTEVTATLTAEWHTFDLFYYIGDTTSSFPSGGYAAAGSASGYGPSGNDTPFAQIDVNVTALKTYTDAVSYVEGSDGNQWHFVPKVEQDMDSAKAFWAAVLACSTAESIEALRSTGLYDDFVGYCLKNQASDGDYHLDGILAQNPPVYVVELHKDGTYMGGSVNGAEGPFPTMAETLALLEGYLGHNITWNEDENGDPIQDANGNYTGTYIIQEGNTTTVYDITVEQTNADSAVTVEGAEIKYQEVGEYYHLAQFEIHSAVSSHTVSYEVIYTDGVDTEDIFSDHEYGADQGDTVPAFTGSATRPGYSFDGWLLESDGTVYSDADIALMTVTSNMVFQAVWSGFQVVFHANNENANGGEDIFRVYYPASATLPDSEPAYHLNADSSVSAFYDLPEFDYEIHNDYIFAGWYLADGTPMDWSTTYAAEAHLYAHWIETGQVAQEDDGKSLSGGVYQGYDLTGLQIRTSENDIDYNTTHGTAGGGLRFITVLKEDVYQQITDLSGGEAEYGFVMAKRAILDTYSTGDDYRLEYKASNVNGEDTTADYSYVINLICSGYPDHFDGEAYRLYTGVVTYKNAAAQGEDVLASAHAADMVARSYIRYEDANGLYRTYYNNYTGDSRIGGGCSASYDTVYNLVMGE